MADIVLAFVPSNKKSDYACMADGDGNWFYEQWTKFYCLVCQEIGICHYEDHKRDVGDEEYYDLRAKKVVTPPRLYITRHPQKGEWEHFKTIDEVKDSELAVKDA